MPKKTTPVKGRETRPRSVLAKINARFELETAALKLVERLALYIVVEGNRCDEPGNAHDAYALLKKHGYVQVGLTLRRPDGSVVTR